MAEEEVVARGSWSRVASRRHVSSGTAHDGTPWCRIPHLTLCSARTAPTLAELRLGQGAGAFGLTIRVDQDETGGPGVGLRRYYEVGMTTVACRERRGHEKRRRLEERDKDSAEGRPSLALSVADCSAQFQLLQRGRSSDTRDDGVADLREVEPGWHWTHGGGGLRDRRCGPFAAP